MALVTKQQLDATFAALETSVRQLMAGTTSLQPETDGYVTEKDAVEYMKNTADTWGQMNVDVFETIRAELIEIMGADNQAPDDIVGKVNRMLDGINLMWSAIRKYMPEPIGSDAPLDTYASFIHN